MAGNPSYIYKDQIGEAEQLGLENLAISKDKYHFRFWSNNQVTDIWTPNGTSYKGRIKSFTKTYSYNEKTQKTKSPKFIFSEVFIDSGAAEKAYNLIKQVAAIPTGGAIRGWSEGLDGIDYAFEYATPTAYEFKSYWTPTAQDPTLVEAKKIQTFILELDSLLKLKQHYSEFFATLKPGEYTNGTMVSIKLTPKQNTYLKG